MPRTCATVARHRPGKRKSRAVRAPREREPRDRQQLVAALGHESRLEPLGRAEHERPSASGSRCAQPIGGREQRIDVAGGAAAGEAGRWSPRALDRAPTVGTRRTGPRDGSRLGTGRCVRANDSTTPIAASVVISAEPPAETSGSGTPSTGSSPSTTAMFTKAWPMIQTMAALVASFANGSLDIRMMRTKQIASTTNSSEHEDRAEQAELLADDREDEVVVGLGQPRPLGRRVAEARRRRCRRARAPASRAWSASSRSGAQSGFVHPPSQASMRLERDELTAMSTTDHRHDHASAAAM